MERWRKPVSVPGVFNPKHAATRKLCELQWETRPCRFPSRPAQWKIVDRRSGPGTFVLQGRNGIDDY